MGSDPIIAWDGSGVIERTCYDPAAPVSAPSSQADHE